MDFPYDHGFERIAMTEHQTAAPVGIATGEPPRRKKSNSASFELAPLQPDATADTTQNRAYRALKMAVLGGAFYPGTIVTLAKLSDMLGTSEMPVREALKRLMAEGAFEALPNRSARIPILSRTRVKQILDLRVELEGRAAAQAAEHMSRRHIDQLAALDAEMNLALSNRQLQRYVALNMEFHFLIYRLADNEPLLTLIEALWLRMAPVVAFNLTQVDEAGAAAQFDRAGLAHHGNIIKAFEAQDPRRASEEIRNDLLHPSTFARYFDELPSMLDSLKARG
ncbi:GntR family transcriptional regulator [Xylophilus sp. ASV27]|uniref:GntR family transcriptional regulator n=1 Tax=Xylophilus sp. ASV27 TaxID=2795129 RepID=UPI0018EC5625|nr:GntR family transcriptional regulator [Xylophilus sp. ASV27]